MDLTGTFYWQASNQKSDNGSYLLNYYKFNIAVISTRMHPRLFLIIKIQSER